MNFLDLHFVDFSSDKRIKSTAVAHDGEPSFGIHNIKRLVINDFHILVMLLCTLAMMMPVNWYRGLPLFQSHLER